MSIQAHKLNVTQRLIVFFWAIWSSIVASGDTFDFLVKMGFDPSLDILSSHNSNLVAQSLEHYHLNNPLLINILFFIIVILSWVVAVFCWRGLFTIKYAYQAFFAIIVIDTLFILSDEFFFQYDLEHGHMDRLAFKLLSFLVFLSLEKISPNK